MSTQAPNEARVIPLRPQASPPASGVPASGGPASGGPARPPLRPAGAPPAPAPEPAREPLWRDLVGGVLRRERLAQERTLKDVAEAARISMPYLSELERGRKEASSEVLAAAARALGLGLGDLLSLAQDDLARHTARRRVARASSVSSVSTAVRGRPSSTAQNDGLCLVA
ncbi:helix-turn-helix domain-containing protein [Streptomyces sp. 1331.2]|uniref:helix-turn-helix domain-containing protein n=1 Tax=Streptomyces sp. 1331.2 TaxID=1938835 RepID=UPI000BCB970C|nr:helix-turn-helix transcriptional regulator [Streptomyces sp. 1331.2]SOB88997.1 Helix-turn-helix [Streptomyces sp. 1331.2]